jgi:hypothetical protein
MSAPTFDLGRERPMKDYFADYEDGMICQLKFLQNSGHLMGSRFRVAVGEPERWLAGQTMMS